MRIYLPGSLPRNKSRSCNASLGDILACRHRRRRSFGRPVGELDKKITMDEIRRTIDKKEKNLPDNQTESGQYNHQHRTNDNTLSDSFQNIFLDDTVEST